MKLSIALTLLFCIAFNNQSSAQTWSAGKAGFVNQKNLKDSLIVHRDNGQLVKITWPFNKKIKNNTEWEVLLTGFQSNFQKIYSDVPDYDFYRIKYLNNRQLIIDEVSGTEIYNVEQQEDIEYIKSSSCLISGKSVSISIGFNDKKELLDPALVEELKSAISMMKYKFGSNLGQEKFNYDAKVSEMLPVPKPQISFGTEFGASLGFVKKQSYVELRAGLGLLIDKKVLVALTSDFLLNYDQQRSITETDIYVGVLMTDYKFGAEYGFKVRGGINDFDDMVLRAGLNYKFLPGTMIGLRYYIRDSRNENVWQNLVWDFRVGYAF